MRNKKKLPFGFWQITIGIILMFCFALVFAWYADKIENDIIEKGNNFIGNRYVIYRDTMMVVSYQFVGDKCILYNGTSQIELSGKYLSTIKKLGD